MTIDEARLVFKGWQDYVEIADKLSRVFTIIPESFLPYPKQVIEDALNIIAKEFFDAGRIGMSNAIQETMCRWLLPAQDDSEAIGLMAKELDLIVKHPELVKAKTTSLKEARDSWARSKTNSQ